MRVTRRVKKYAETHFNGVIHTTLNPEGPGVVRIHMIPPVYDGKTLGNSIVILNGQDIIPVGTSWSVVLSELIAHINEYAGHEVSDEEAQKIVADTAKAVKKVYPVTSKKRIADDIYRIMKTFTQVAYGAPVDEEIGYMTMGEYASFMRAPHRMDLMVSAMTKDGQWHCNQKCVHCYAAGQKQSDEKELTTDEWKKIIDKCREVGIPQVTFTGGEPTMRDDLVELIDYAQWFVTRLNTNGIRLTKELCEKLHDASLDSMQITFYSANADIHNRLVGAERYNDTVTGIENALAAGISLSINTPLCTLNADYLSTLRFLHDKGVKFVTCSGLITTGNATCEQSERLQLTHEEISNILKNAADYCFANGMEISFTSPGWVTEQFCTELGINAPTCGACLSNMAITPGGNIVPCQSWLSDDVLGNMLKDDWDKVWNSEACLIRRDYSARMSGTCPLRTDTGRAGSAISSEALGKEGEDNA